MRFPRGRCGVGLRSSSRRVRGRYERALAAREATAAAGYLTIVTPLARGGTGYDLPQLLIRARALEELPGFSGRFEIYHATAPLVRATAPPLAAATLQRLRREVAVRWTGDAAPRGAGPRRRRGAAGGAAGAGGGGGERGGGEGAAGAAGGRGAGVAARGAGRGRAGGLAPGGPPHRGPARDGRGLGRLIESC